jgi:hypothetical protein
VGERALRASRTSLDIDAKPLLRRLEVSGTRTSKDVVEAPLFRNVRERPRSRS